MAAPKPNELERFAEPRDVLKISSLSWANFFSRPRLRRRTKGETSQVESCAKGDRAAQERIDRRMDSTYGSIYTTTHP